MFCYVSPGLVVRREEEEIIFNLLIRSLPPSDLTESGNILIAKVKSSQTVGWCGCVSYITIMMCETQ